MSIQGIHGTPLTVSPTSHSAATARAPQKATEQAEPRSEGTDESKPAPLRFPWLSRLSTQLAAAANKPTTFQAPVLGDHLDKQA